MRRALTTAILFALYAFAALAADVWVDINGTGDGSSELSPTSDWMAAISNATENTTIYIMGGGGREYAVTSVSMRVWASAENLRLVAWPDEPKPVFRVANCYGQANPVFRIQGNGFEMESLRFEFPAGIGGYGCSTFWLELMDGGVSRGCIPSNVVIRSCEFDATAGYTSGRGGLFMSGATSGVMSSGFMATNCFFANFTYSVYGGEAYPFHLFGYAPEFVGNVFTNCAWMLRPAGNDANRGLRFSHNIVIDQCKDDGRGLLFPGYRTSQEAVICHNIFINQNGKQDNIISVFGNSDYSFNDSYFYNNTLVNFGAIFRAESRWASGDTCGFHAFNNLVVGGEPRGKVAALIYDACDRSDRLFFRQDTEIRNNYIASQLPVFHATNTAVAVSFEANIANNYTNGTSLAAVAFRSIDVGDWSKPKFCLPGATCAMEIRNGGIGGDFPTYIGAKEPDGGIMTIILIR